MVPELSLTRVHFAHGTQYPLVVLFGLSDRAPGGAVVCTVLSRTQPGVSAALLGRCSLGKQRQTPNCEPELCSTPWFARVLVAVLSLPVLVLCCGACRVPI